MTASPTGMPPLPPPLARVYDRAQADATRSGHGEVTPAHLTLALAMSHPELVDQVLGRATVAAATLALSMAARSFAEPAPNEPCRQALRSAAGSSDPLGALAALLRAAAPAVTPAGPATGAARFELTALRAGYAEVVSAPAWLIARPDLVEPTIAALAAGRSPLVVAAEGSGRSTTAALLAARLHVPGYGGPLAGRAVVRVRTADIVAVETGPALHALLQEVAGRAVVVLDDLEVLSGLGGGSRLDAGLLAVVRGAAHDSAHLLVLLLARPYDQALAGQEPELVEECVLVEPAGLDPGQVATVAQRRARELSEMHRVEVGPDAIDAALSPPGGGDRASHPGLAVRRLEQAAAVVAVRADRTVHAHDVVPPAVRVGFDPVGFRAVLAGAIVGQDPVLDAVVRRLSVTRPELDLRPHRPDAVFLFAGPTGTGKTALAEAMAVALHGSVEGLVRLDMSEYSEPHTVSRLIGSPPGYVGSTDPSSWLTTKILAHPDCVLLLDEIEKADPLVWNTFLQVFDAGRLSDGLGRSADFARVVVVMTTNIGARVFEGRTSDSHGDLAVDSAAVLAQVKARMAPELVNRLDGVLVFAPLTAPVVRTIAGRMIEDIVRRMVPRGYQLSFDEDVVDLVATAGYDPAFGARPLQRAVEALLVVPLAGCAPGSWHASSTGQQVSWAPA